MTALLPPAASAGADPAGSARSVGSVTSVTSGRRGSVLAVRVVGGLLVAAVLVAGAASVVAGFFQRHVDTTTPVTGTVTQVVVDDETGDVVLRPAEAGSPADVTTRAYWSWNRPEVQTSLVDGVLTVSARCSGHLFSFCGADLTLAVPAGTPVRVTTGTGDIRSTVPGALELRTDTGDVTVAAGEGTTVHATTGTGDVTVTGAPASVSAGTDTGDARLTLSAPPTAVDVTTGTGDATVTVPAGDSYRVSADAGTGDVRVTVPKDEAAPRRVSVHTGTGDATVRAR